MGDLSGQIQTAGNSLVSVFRAVDQVKADISGETSVVGGQDTARWLQGPQLPAGAPAVGLGIGTIIALGVLVWWMASR